MNVVRTALLIVRKDLAVELRSREVIVTMTLFALLVIVIFAFTFQIDTNVTQKAAPGLLWVTVVFAGNLGIARAMDREREHGAMQGLLIGPAGALAVYWGKAIGVLLFMLVMEILIVPLALLFVGISLPASGIGLLVASMALGTLGFALVATLFGAMLAEVRLREVLIPLVVYPIVVPVIIAGVQLTSIALGGAVMDGRDSDGSSDYLFLLAGFDLVYAAVAPWVFARTMVD